MHCIGELIEAIARWPGLRYGASTVCRAAPTAAIIRSEPMAMMRSQAANGMTCRRAHPTRTRSSPRRCCRRTRDPAAVSARSRALRRSTRRPHRPPPRSRPPCSGRSASCSRRSTAPSSPRARNACADRERAPRCRARRRPARTVSSRIDLGRRARRPHQHDRLAGLEQRAKIRRAAHLEDDRRDEPRSAIDPRAGERRALPLRGAFRRPRAPATRNSAAGRTAPDGSGAPPRGARTTTSTMVGVSRSTRTSVARSSSSRWARNAESVASDAGAILSSRRETIG